MDTACRILAIACLSASLCAFAQQRDSVRIIVLPNPELIHCHASECSQLWKQAAGNTEAVYPSQVLTDLVNGEIVGLTAVYDKSVSTNELRDAVNKLYGKWSLVDLQNDKAGVWRVEADQLVVSLFPGADGAKQIIYLKFGPFGSQMPSAHINNCKK